MEWITSQKLIYIALIINTLKSLFSSWLADNWVIRSHHFKKKCGHDGSIVRSTNAGNARLWLRSWLKSIRRMKWRSYSPAIINLESWNSNPSSKLPIRRSMITCQSTFEPFESTVHKRQLKVVILMGSHNKKTDPKLYPTSVVRLNLLHMHMLITF